MSKPSPSPRAKAKTPAKKNAAPSLGKELPVAPAPPFIEGSLSGDAGGLQVPATPAPGPIAKAVEPATDRLPQGALIGLRQSGGLRFNTIDVVVFNDGRVQWSKIATAEGSKSGERKLTGPKLAALKTLIEAAALSRVKRSRGKQPPDALAYQILSPEKTVEVFSGAIPETIAPLIEALQKLVPKR